MNGIRFAVVLATGLICVFPAQANEALVKAKNCFSCHLVDKKLVGPSYKDVAAKYKGDKDALVSLATKVNTGGKGVWGELPMPPNNVSDDEAKKMVAWILSQK